MTAWREEYEKGGPETERLDFERLALEIMQVQMKVKQRARRANIQRAFHAKAVYTAVDAELCFVDDLPADLHAGFAQPGKRYPAIVRLSNANGAGQADVKRDLRGMALRVKVGDEVAHDLLATNYPVSHARNARQFVAFAKATAGGTLDKVVGLIALSFEFGPRETVRMLRNVMKARRTVPSLALEAYWSRGAIRWGETLAVRYQFRPAADAPSAPPPATHDPDFLSREFAHRLDRKEVRFDLCLQRFVDARTTPIEDTAVEWNELAAPPVKVATLVLSKPRTSANETLAEGRMVEELAFNPWHKLPLRLSLLNLDAFRFVLRRKNLIDTEVREAPPQARPVPAPVPEDVRRTRQADGRYTDVSAAEMGAAGAAFGRNLPPILPPELFDTPSPIRVSREL